VSRTRTRRSVALAVALLVVLGACAKKDTDEERILRNLDSTADLSGRFVYNENVGGQEVIVRGLIEDDFRYKARLTLNGNDVLDEVVNDDSLAVRFLDAGVVPNFVDTGASTSAVSALSERRWVIDRTGAPPVGLALTDAKYAGIDPVVDSLAVMAYAREAITQGDGLRKYNPESLDYRPAEDPFPTPKDNSGIERWDVVAPAFPKPDVLSRTTNTDAAFADVAQFRKLSVYVQDHRVIQVRERIAAEGKVLEKFGQYLQGFAATAGPDAEKQVDQILDRFEGEQRAQLLLQAYNALLKARGRAPIRFRTLSYELRDLGAKVQVGLPIDVVEGKLDFFGVNAVKEDDAAATAGRGGKAGSASTTTTTAVAAATGDTSTTTTP
jgi:hypothetical protein